MQETELGRQGETVLERSQSWGLLEGCEGTGFQGRLYIKTHVGLDFSGPVYVLSNTKTDSVTSASVPVRPQPRLLRSTILGDPLHTDKAFESRPETGPYPCSYATAQTTEVFGRHLPNGHQVHPLFLWRVLQIGSYSHPPDRPLPYPGYRFEFSSPVQKVGLV